jgi:tRNA G18 (ribose-2'-O)-methylase SpoU
VGHAALIANGREGTARVTTDDGAASGWGEGSLQLAGAAEIDAAWDAGAPVTRLLVRRDADDPAVERLVARARARGIPVLSGSAGDLRRLSRRDPPEPVLALLSREPDADAAAALAGRGAAWLLLGATYPGNVGAVIRTAEVTGADAVFVDAPLDHAGRRAALRTSMNAERLLPVRFEAAGSVLERARAAGRRVIGVEDTGDAAPWEVDLRGPVLFVAGGEDRSVPPEILVRCDAVVRLPMRGFIPCYNLQAAVAAVALERLRQEGAAAE